MASEVSLGLSPNSAMNSYGLTQAFASLSLNLLICEIRAVLCSHVCVSLSVMSDSVTSVDCSPPGSSVHGILQARILGCHALFQGIFWTQGWNLCPCVSCSGRPFIGWCGLNETLHTLPGPEQGLKTSRLNLPCASEAEKIEQSVNTSLDNEDHLNDGTSDRQSSGGQNEARGLPGKGRGLSKRLRVGNGWGRFRIAQLMSLAGADGSHGGRMGGKTERS